jgi:hypothetical protein
MLTHAFRDTLLGNLGGFIGLIKSITDFRAGTVVEAAYTGYGVRPAVAWAAAADTVPTGGRQRSNSAIVSFPANTGANEDQIAFSQRTSRTLYEQQVLRPMSSRCRSRQVVRQST